MTKEPSPETKHAHADPTPTARQRTSARRIIAFAVFGVAVLVLGIPLWASLTYRWAVDDLHVALSTISIQSTKTVNAEVDNCWAGIAPASVRYIFPVTGDIDMNAARDSFADALEVRKRIGYMAEDQQMYGWMRVGQIINWVAGFYPNWDMKFTDELVDILRLSKDTKVKALSKGQNSSLALLSQHE